MEQQQCDWTRQCLCDPTGQGPLVPPSAKCQSITRLVCGSLKCATPCWRVLPSLFRNLPRCPCKKIKSLFSFFFSFTDTTQESKTFQPSASPLLLQQFAVALPPLLIDRIRVQYDQTDYDESYGGGGNQQFQC